MSFEKMAAKNSEKRYGYACRQGYCPSLEERENSGIRELAGRLSASSDKETLTNVLEWQDRNVVFWFERNPLSLALSSILVVLLITSPFLLLREQIVYAYFAVLVSIIVTLASVAVYMIHSYRKLPLKQLLNISRLNVPIDSILENRLCVCRDYAKLTACLLSNIYPEAEVYFAHATNHVAAAMMIEKKLYVLDKYLPLTTMDRWHERWHKGEFSEKTVEKVKGSHLELLNINSFLSKENIAQLDTERLATELKRLLSIKDSTDNAEEASLKIWQWKKGALLYEDDEIVNYSLAQGLKMKISSQILDLTQLTGIEISREQDDLSFQVRFKLNK
jgi:predicted transglutaminase-like protease